MRGKWSTLRVLWALLRREHGVVMAALWGLRLMWTFSSLETPSSASEPEPSPCTCKSPSRAAESSSERTVALPLSSSLLLLTSLCYPEGVPSHDDLMECDDEAFDRYLAYRDVSYVLRGK
jgi:hypothetical protein